MTVLNVADLLKMPDREISDNLKTLTLYEIFLSHLRRRLLSLKWNKVKFEEEGAFEIKKSFKPKVDIPLESDNLIEAAVRAVEVDLNNDLQDYKLEIDWKFESLGNNPKSYLWLVAKLNKI